MTIIEAISNQVFPKPKIYKIALAILLTGLLSISSSSIVLAGDYDCSVSQSQIPTAECDALVSLYNSAGGVSWTTKTDWLISSTPCSWYGVTCSAGTNVTSLNLFNNGLVGSLPSALGNLSNLTDLNLAINSLTNSIPTQLGNLSNLTDLNLAFNSLDGSIPSELGNLSNLTKLLLINNSLTGGIPPELGNLSNLTYLNLAFNSLDGSILTELSNLSNLTTLYLNNNNLSGIVPAELGNLANMQFLDLGGNSLTGGIPTELGNLSNLIHLFLNENSLSGIVPAELGNLTNLADLRIYGNASLTGWLPSSLTNLASLIVFWFSGTTLCERPDSAFQIWLDGISLLTSTDVVCNVIFADGFESNDFSAWVGLNTGNGDLNVCAAAAMEGSYGACVDVVSQKRKQVWDQSMTDAASYQARFYFDPNGLSMGDNEKIRLMQLRTGVDTIRPAFVQVRYKNGGYEIRIRAQTDAGVTLSGSWYSISDAPVAIDIDWMAATGDGNDDGYVTLWLDGVVKGTIGGIDNDTLRVNEVKLGFTSRLGTKIISGTFYLDGFMSSDDGFIGP